MRRTPVAAILAIVVCLPVGPAGAAAGDPVGGSQPDAVATPPAPSPVPTTAGGSPALGAWPRELPRNFGRLFDRDTLDWLIFGTTATGFTTIFDERFADYFRDDPNREFMGSLGDVGNVAGNPGIAAAASGTLMLVAYNRSDDRLRRVAFGVTQGLVIDTLLVQALKFSIQRERPDGSDNYSFPSGHASNAFTWAPILAHEYGWKVGVPAYAAATFISLSRVEQNRHHLSDVTAGAFVGYIVGRTVIRGTDQASRPGPVSIGPLVTADGPGVAMSISLDRLRRPRRGGGG